MLSHLRWFSAISTLPEISLIIKSMLWSTSDVITPVHMKLRQDIISFWKISSFYSYRVFFAGRCQFDAVTNTCCPFSLHIVFGWLECVPCEFNIIGINGSRLNRYGRLSLTIGTGSFPVRTLNLTKYLRNGFDRFLSPGFERYFEPLLWTRHLKDKPE